jgi:hypothetical protein
VACGEGEECRAGVCSDPCVAGGGARCGGACVALAGDPSNCGACGITCGQGRLCVRGACVAPACPGAPGLPGRPDLFTTVRSKELLARDLDGDGLADLAVADFEGTVIQVLRGRADGTFAAPETIDTGTPGWHTFGAGDVDGDGQTELLVAASDAYAIDVFRVLDGAIVHAARLDAIAPYWPQVGDVDGDGLPDVVYRGGTVQAVTGAGGTWSLEDRAVWNVDGFALADVTGDGRADLLVVREGEPDVRVYLGSATGIIGASPGATPASAVYGPYGVQAADLDDDGDLDVIVWGYDDGGEVVSVLRNAGGGAFDPPEVTRLPPLDGGYRYDLLVRDLDGDGAPDLAIGELSGLAGGSTIRILRNRGDGTWELPRLVPSATAQALAAVDADGDGRLDLVAASAPNAGVQLLRGDGALGFPAPEIVDAQAAQVALADLDGDGRADVIATDYAAGTLRTFRSLGDRLAPPATYPMNVPQSLAIADVNGDGAPDVLVGGNAPRAGVDAGVSLFLNRGDGTLLPEVRLGGVAALRVFAADLNGDGVPDLAVQSDDGVAALLGRGDGAFTAPPAVTDASGEQLIGAGDVDGDGLAELVTLVLHGLPGTQEVRVRHLLADGALGDAAAYALPPVVYPYQPTGLVADLDGDGLADVLIATDDLVYQTLFDIVATGRVLLLRGGRGGLAAATPYATASAGGGVAAGSVSGGGRRDLVVLEPRAWSVALLPARGDGSFGPPRRWALGSQIETVATGDVDGDGRDDVVVGGMWLWVLRGGCAP